jgi:hypothetical protein
MMRRFTAAIAMICLAASLPAVTTGCAGKAESSEPARAAFNQLPAEERIRRIQNNPSIPMQAKQIAIDKIRGEQNAGSNAPPAAH